MTLAEIILRLTDACPGFSAKMAEISCRVPSHKFSALC